MLLFKVTYSFVGDQVTTHFDNENSFRRFLDNLIDNRVWFDVEFPEVTKEEAMAIMKKGGV